MQYTLRNIPPKVDAALRQRARNEGKSLNVVAIEALVRGAGIDGSEVRHRNLDDVAGTWADDAAFDEAVADQHRIDKRQWR